MLKKYSLIFLGALSWSLVMVKSGWVYSYGIGFWGPNGHDGVWHIALAEGLARGSFDNPVFVGEAMKNYHLGFDLLLAVLNKITSIPISTLYFQILPPIFAVLIGYLTYEFVFVWLGSKTQALIATFFVYFGGSFGWILGKGESAFWSQQAVSTLINPPFALSLILILSGLISLLKKKTLLAILFFGPLIQIKAYAAVLVLGALLISRHYKIFFGSAIFSLALFLLTKSSGFPFTWQPFWFLETMMGLSDRVGWEKFGEAMVNYKAGGVWLKAISAYGIAFLIFVVGNFATRLIFLKKLKFDSIGIFLYSIIAAGVVIPLFFLQKGTPWNTIQFMYYSLFFSGILAGIAVSRYTKYYILYTIALLTIPTSILTLKDVYLPARPPAMLPDKELEALNFLKNQHDGVVLTYPFDKNKAREAEANPPRPLYLYESTAYVSAYSAKPVFLEDEVNLDITGYSWQERRIRIENFFKNPDKNFLVENNIKYIYLVGYQKEQKLDLKKIFENEEVIIYEHE